VEPASSHVSFRRRGKNLPLRIREAGTRITLAGVAVAAMIGATGSSPSADPLAAEIDRWSRYVRTNPSTDAMWLEAREGLIQSTARAEEALRAGRRLLAAERLAHVQPDLEASVYLGGLTATARHSDEAFEAAWAEAGRELAAGPRTAGVEGVQPAAVRAIGEAAAPAARVYYEASREYERNTMPEAGFYYLGVARGELGLQVLCRSLSTPSKGAPPPVRSIREELDDLKGELLAAYRPPASIDRHKEFIGASATLKEARELDASGLRYGALLRYLQAALQSAALRGKAPALTPTEAARRLQEARSRLSRSQAGTDDSLGMLFVEAGEDDVAGSTAGKPPAAASAILADVLPRYFAALEPARPRPPQPAPSVTVTLVRWPYT
jgi:hypothetical protein